MKTYLLKPNMTFTTLNTKDALIKPAFSPPLSKAQDHATRAIVDAIAPTPPASPKTVAIGIAATLAAKTWPPRQPLPTPVLYPDKPSIKLGLDVHLEFLMARWPSIAIRNCPIAGGECAPGKNFPPPWRPGG